MSLSGPSPAPRDGADTPPARRVGDDAIDLHVQHARQVGVAFDAV